MNVALEVLFFPNGNTVVLKDGKQVSELQESWLLTYASYLKSKGIELNEVTFKLPCVRIAKVFETSKGNYDWRFIDE